MKIALHWLKRIILKILRAIGKEFSTPAQISFAYLRAVWWLRSLLYFVVIIVALAAWIQVAKSADEPNSFAEWIYIFLNDWAVALSATVTLLIVIAASFAILDNRHARRLDRRERLLKELSEWAINILKSRAEVPRISTISGLSSKSDIEIFKEVDNINLLNAANLLIRYEWLDSEANYIESITAIFKRKALKTAVKKTVDSLREHIEAIKNITGKERTIETDEKNEASKQTFDNLKTEAIELLKTIATMKKIFITDKI